MRDWVLSSKNFRPIALLLVVLPMALLVGCRATEGTYLARGKQLAEKKEYARALLEFKNASRLNPKSPEPYYQAGLALLAMGDYQGAYRNLVAATEMDSKYTAAQLKVAEIIGSSVTSSKDPQNLQDAEKRVQSILAIVPDSVEALSALGITEYMLGKPDDALKHLEAALEKFPQHLQSASALAMIKLKQNDFAGAEQVVKKVADESPRSAEAQVALGRFYTANRMASEAEAAYRRALNIDAKYGPALLDLAQLQIRTGRQLDAEKTLAALSALPDKQYRHVHAVFLFEQGKQDEALKEFEVQAKDDPKDREAFLRLTSAYFFTKRFPDAEKAINAALKRNSRDTSALLERSRLYLITARSSEAETDLNQVLRIEPNSATAHYLLAKVNVARGRPLAGSQELSRALDLNPSLLARRIELAQHLIAQKDAKGAPDLLDKTPEDQKKLLPVIVARNWAVFNIGRQEELRKTISGELAAYNRAPDLVLQDGLLKFQAKDIAGARKSLEEVLAARPEDLLALDALARTFVSQKQPDLALRTVEQYANRRPNSAPIQNLLGDWMLASGRPDAARKAYTAALATAPSLLSARMNLARLETREGKLDAARQTLKAFVGTSAAEAIVEGTLGMIEEKAGNPTAAILHYRKAVDVDPHNVVALNNLAYLLANNTDQLDEALQRAQQAKELDANNVAVEDTIGWAFYRKGQYASAVTHLRNAVAKDRNAVPKYHLAMAYLKNGELQAGRNSLDEALLMAPNLPEAVSAQQLFAGQSGRK